MNQHHPLITPEELEQLAEIDRLLKEANTHMYKIGMCGKSSEGHLEVSFGTHDDRNPDQERYTPQVSIYTSMLGPHRRNDFDSPQQALDVVRVWHHNALLKTSEDDWNWEGGEPGEKELLDHYEEISLIVSNDPKTAKGNRRAAEKVFANLRRDIWQTGHTVGFEDALLACEIILGLKPGPPPGPTPNPHEKEATR